MAKEIWVGDPAYGASLQLVITALGSTEAIVRVHAAIHSIPTNLSIPSNITLVIERGAIISIANGVTLTINGGFEAGLYQVFSMTGTGAVTFGSGYVNTLHSEWFGTNQAALQACLNAGISSKTVLISNNYSLTSELTLTNINNAVIQGASRNVTITQATALAKALHLTNCTYITIDNLTFTGNGTTDLWETVSGGPRYKNGDGSSEDAIFIEGDTGSLTSYGNKVLNCTFTQWVDNAIRVYYGDRTTVKGCNVTGITTTGTNSGGNTHKYNVAVWNTGGQLIAQDNDFRTVTYGFVNENLEGGEDTGVYEARNHDISNNFVLFSDYATAGIYDNFGYNVSYCFNKFKVPSTARLHEGTIDINGTTKAKIVGNVLSGGFIRLQNGANDIDLIGNSIKDVLNTGTTTWPGIYTSSTAPTTTSSCYDVRIVGGEITNIVGSSGKGISLQQGARNITINGVQISECDSYGIQTSHNTNDVLVDNININNCQIWNCSINIAITGGTAGQFGTVNIYNNTLWRTATGVSTYGIYVSTSYGGFRLGIGGNSMYGFLTANYYNGANYPTDRKEYTAAPTTGTWVKGQFVTNYNAATGQPIGWFCTASGTFSAFSDTAGDTDGSTNAITGMASTSGLFVGDFVTVSAGFASTGPYRVVEITSATAIKIEVNSNSAQNNITTATPDPTWATGPNVP